MEETQNYFLMPHHKHPYTKTPKNFHEIYAIFHGTRYGADLSITCVNHSTNWPPCELWCDIYDYATPLQYSSVRFPVTNCPRRRQANRQIRWFSMQKDVTATAPVSGNFTQFLRWLSGLNGKKKKGLCVCWGCFTAKLGWGLRLEITLLCWAAEGWSFNTLWFENIM